MFDGIRLTDFQRHASLAVRLAPGVTTLVGRTAAGKTTVLRAVRWLCLGGDSGGFVRHGAASCEVVLEADGRQVARRKGGRVNSYRIDDGEPYDAVKQGVPNDVTALLNVSEVSFQGQHDAPFLLFETAGEVGRVLNRVVNLDLIDSTLSALDAETRRERDEQKRAAEALEKAEAEAAATDWIDGFVRDAEALGGLGEAADEADARYQGVSKAAEKLAAGAAGTDRHQWLLYFASNCLKAGERWLRESEKHAALTKAVATVASRPITGVSAETAARVNAFGLATLERARQWQELRNAAERLAQARQAMAATKSKLGQARAEASELLAGACPLCGRS